jgi:hypothetical protein
VSRTFILLLLVATAVISAGCATLTAIDTNSIAGLTLRQCVIRYNLKQYKSWDLATVPPYDDSSVTYLMERGNLTLWLDSDRTVTSAAFLPSALPPEERLRLLGSGWIKYVRETRGAAPLQAPVGNPQSRKK